ncbi:hypothetical protein GCM10027398_33990 [Azotobacter salinestris]
MEAWQAVHPGQDVFEDRALEITGYLPISVEDWSRAPDTRSGHRHPALIIAARSKT